MQGTTPEELLSLICKGRTAYNESGAPFELIDPRKNIPLDQAVRVRCRQQGYQYLPTMGATLGRKSVCGSVFLITPRQALSGSPALDCRNTHWPTVDHSAPYYVLQALEEIFDSPFTDWDVCPRDHPKPVAVSRYFKLVVYQTSKKQAIQKKAVFEAARGAYKLLGYTTIILGVSAKKALLCEKLLSELEEAGLTPKLSLGDLITYMTNMGNECLFLEDRESFECKSRCAC